MQLSDSLQLRGLDGHCCCEVLIGTVLITGLALPAVLQDDSMYLLTLSSAFRFECWVLEGASFKTIDTMVNTI